MFIDLPSNAEGKEAQEKVKDINGKEWDGVMRGSFHFEFVNGEGGGDNKHGLVMKGSHIFAETGPFGT